MARNHSLQVRILSFDRNTDCMNEVIMSLSEIKLGVERAKADYRIAKAEMRAAEEASESLFRRKMRAEASLSSAIRRIEAYETITDTEIINRMNGLIIGDTP